MGHYEVFCSDLNCDFELHDPFSEAYVCKGWLKQNRFVNGFYYRGDFGGEIIDKVLKEDIMGYCKENPDLVDHKTVGPCKIEDDNCVYIIRINEELKEKRINAVKGGLIGDIKWHEIISTDLFGPAYCMYHALKRKFICEQCEDDLVLRSDDLYNKMYMMDSESFLEIFCTSAIFG